MNQFSKQKIIWITLISILALGLVFWFIFYHQAQPKKITSNTPGTFTILSDTLVRNLREKNNISIAEKYKVGVFKDVVYGKADGKDMLLDIYQPVGVTAPTPVVIFSHGGGFHAGSKDGGNDMGITFAGYGYTLVSINYRLSSEAIFPAPVHDLNGAIRFLRANASTYNLDAAHIGLIGGSAGSALSTITGVTWNEPDFYNGTVGGNLDESTKVSGVVDAFGSFHSGAEAITRDQQQLAGSEEFGCQVFTAECESQMKAFLPEYHLDAGDPPFLIINGDKDIVSPLQNAQAIYNDMKTAGIDVTLIVGKGYGHGNEITFAYLPEIIQFFDRVFAK